MTSYRKRTRIAGLAIIIALGATACDAAGNPPAAPLPGPGLPTLPSTVSKPAPPPAEKQSVDYRRLLIKASDVSDSDDTFTERSSTDDPNGLPGASALFVNADDTRAIAATFVVYPDDATADATLRQAVGTITTMVAQGTPRPVDVGSGGTVISGTSPDGTKAVTLLLYSDGPAVVRLEFQSNPGDVTTDRFVTSIAKMQLIALRVGLPGGD